LKGTAAGSTEDTLSQDVSLPVKADLQMLSFEGHKLALQCLQLSLHNPILFYYSMLLVAIVFTLDYMLANTLRSTKASAQI
jgi:hypothetical protein